VPVGGSFFAGLADCPRGRFRARLDAAQCRRTAPVEGTRLKPRHAFLLALLLIGANLRAAITGVGPVLETIRGDLGLSAGAAGLLASLPVLIFAIFAPLARLARHFGAERMILAGLLLLLAGLIVRSVDGVPALFTGTVVLAVGIASTNVLLPVVVKHHYPDSVPAMTMAYATVMGSMAALASGVTIPLAEWLPGGWRTSLASWALLAALAWVVWWPHARRAAPAVPDPRPAASGPHAAGPAPAWRTAVAWQVTGFMGLQSTVFYVAVTWFPVILLEAGFTPAAAGWLLTVYQVAALLAGIAVPVLIRRFRDQRGIAVGMASLMAVAILGVLWAPEWSVLWVIVLGCGSGPALILALSFMGLRARTHESAAMLSLMANGVGYFIASLGPVIFGLTHDLTGGWTAALLGLVALAACLGLFGLGAGRNVKV
jgi:CP family cyanate transporter-like MFS transporter